MEEKKASFYLLLKRSSAKVQSEDQQPGSATETSDHRSPQKSVLRHLKIAKYKIDYAKDFGTEEQVVHYCTKYLNDFLTSYYTLCNRANAYCKLEKYDRAIEDLNSAIQLKPQRTNAWYLRGAAKGLKESYTDAICDLNKAILINPSNCLALKCRAYCYYKLKIYEEALCDIKMVIIMDFEVGGNNWAPSGVSDTKGKGKAF
ncbi:hypothetical protein Glove_19g172 [Diversispora epigaea]|uniref:Uncharacterized protein n=1 Tax=Diversispora epigaea TaxID=1348612 RepID=A0A397JSV9_9GLOM|nr:hypothetical protein Glove_19g172 [Diversispora epigaea]